MSGDVFYPWHVKSLIGKGIKEFADFIEQITFQDGSEIIKWTPGAMPVEAPQIEEVLVIILCGNELCVDDGDGVTKTKLVDGPLLP